MLSLKTFVKIHQATLDESLYELAGELVILFPHKMHEHMIFSIK